MNKRSMLWLIGAGTGAVLTGLCAGAAQAQALTVLPVSIQMAPGQQATTLTIINQGDKPTSVQVRGFNWIQKDGADQLIPTESLVRSPPLGTIPPGSSQVVRLVLRAPVTTKEGTYRVLLDQIPGPAEPGTVRLALRLSIPVFVEPATRTASHLSWRVQNSGAETYLVAVNDGTRHDMVRDIAVGSGGEGGMKVTAGSPYVLAGSTRRWLITGIGHPLASGSSVRLTGIDNAGAIDQPVLVAANP